MKNRQKLLIMVQKLHERGYEKLRVVPSLSPSGLSWRCEFVNNNRDIFYASNWIGNFEEGTKMIQHTPEKLADLFVRENSEFLKDCTGPNKEYTKWYRTMLKSLKAGELPYAYSDYFGATDFWQTSEDNQIKTLPGEKDNYFNY